MGKNKKTIPLGIKGNIIMKKLLFCTLMFLSLLPLCSAQNYDAGIRVKNLTGENIYIKFLSDRSRYEDGMVEKSDMDNWIKKKKGEEYIEAADSYNSTTILTILIGVEYKTAGGFIKINVIGAASVGENDWWDNDDYSYSDEYQFGKLKDGFIGTLQHYAGGRLTTAGISEYQEESDNYGTAKGEDVTITRWMYPMDVYLIAGKKLKRRHMIVLWI